MNEVKEEVKEEVADIAPFDPTKMKKKKKKVVIQDPADESVDELAEKTESLSDDIMRDIGRIKSATKRAERGAQLGKVTPQVPVTIPVTSRYEVIPVAPPGHTPGIVRALGQAGGNSAELAAKVTNLTTFPRTTKDKGKRKTIDPASGERAPKAPNSFSSVPSWLQTGFVFPTDDDAWLALCEEVKDVPTIQNLQNSAIMDGAEGVGNALVNRIADQDLYDRTEGLDEELVLSRFGTCMSFASTYMQLMTSRTINIKASMKKLEDEQAQAAKQITEAEQKRKEAEDTAADLKAKLTLASNLARQLRLGKEAAVKSAEQLQLQLAQRDEVLSKARQAMERLQSQEHRLKIIAQYKKTLDFEDDIRDEAMRYLQQGKEHILRQMATEGTLDWEKVAGWYDMDPLEPAARLGHAMVPFQEDELHNIKKRDIEDDRAEWIPPKLVAMNLRTILPSSVRPYKPEEFSEPTLSDEVDLDELFALPPPPAEQPGPSSAEQPGPSSLSRDQATVGPLN